jgi:hypothetical protein
MSSECRGNAMALSRDVAAVIGDVESTTWILYGLVLGCRGGVTAMLCQCHGDVLALSFDVAAISWRC